MKYLNGDCKCKKCGKTHYCPDGCAVHFKEGKCTCVKCWMKMDTKEKLELEKSQGSLSNKKFESYTGDVIEGCKEWYWAVYLKDIREVMNNFENKLRNNHFIMTEELLKELLQELGLGDKE